MASEIENSPRMSKRNYLVIVAILLAAAITIIVISLGVSSTITNDGGTG